MKNKHNSSGEFQKGKAELVTGGDAQDKTLYNELSSPTVSLDYKSSRL